MVTEQVDIVSPETGTGKMSRRRFVAGAAAAAAAANLGGLAIPWAKAQDAQDNADGGQSNGERRANKSFEIRKKAAARERQVPIPAHPTNGDEARFADKCGTFTKCLPHDNFGRVEPSAFESFLDALNSGKAADFENITMGLGRKLVNPQAGLCFDLEGTDSAQLSVPPPPSAASAAYAAELIELYWGSLLRDVPFTQYGSSPLAAEAAAELSSLPAFVGPRNSSGQITPDLLFRGSFPGETVGPYISQFFITPTNLGAQPISQKQVTYLPNIDYMTDFNSWLDVQNGGASGLINQVDPQMRYMHSGRDLAAWTHVDVLDQAYFVAFLVLGTLGVPTNPGCPYNNSRTQIGFGTFGGSHASGMIGEVAYRALERSWFQKWFVHRRTRPEGGGGIVHLVKTGQGSKTTCTPDSTLLKSSAVLHTFNKYGSFLLPQAFPEGSPAHPSYPTGHGVVAGACITALKFFFDGNHVIQNPLVPSDDGSSLAPFTGPARLTVNGELNKLGHNVSFGHGIHAGIHYRSDTDSSLMLGEAVALSIFEDQAQTFNERFTINITKFDGTIATISNEP